MRIEHQNEANINNYSNKEWRVAVLVVMYLQNKLGGDVCLTMTTSRLAPSPCMLYCRKCLLVLSHFTFAHLSAMIFMIPIGEGSQDKHSNFLKRGSTSRRNIKHRLHVCSELQLTGGILWSRLVRACWDRRVHCATPPCAGNCSHLICGPILLHLSRHTNQCCSSIQPYPLSMSRNQNSK